MRDKIPLTKSPGTCVHDNSYSVEHVQMPANRKFRGRHYQLQLKANAKSHRRNSLR